MFLTKITFAFVLISFVISFTIFSHLLVSFERGFMSYQCLLFSASCLSVFQSLKLFSGVVEKLFEVKFEVKKTNGKIYGA